MSAFLKVISCSTLDSSPCVVFAGENNRILFDAGEGAQRLCVEHRVRLLKVDSICLTKVCPSTCSGLPGLVLTIADIGKKEISILGPPNTAQFWHMTRHFLYRPDFKIKIDEFGDTTSIDYKDFFLHCIPLHYDHNNAKSVCYVCETKEQLGKFDIAKAKALGIPIGPLCSQLKKGNSITLPNGQVILSTDVVGPSLDGRCVAIICDLSDANEDMLLDALTLHPFWNRYKHMNKSGPSLSNVRPSILDCIVHFSSSRIIIKPKYQNWLQSFSSADYYASCRTCLTNIYLGPRSHMSHHLHGLGISPFIASARYSKKLHSIFPLLFTTLDFDQDDNDDTSSNDVAQLEHPIKMSDNKDAHNRDIPASAVHIDDSGPDINMCYVNNICGAVGLVYNLLPLRINGIDTECKIFTRDRVQQLLSDDVTSLWERLGGSEGETARMIQDVDVVQSEMKALSSVYATSGVPNHNVMGRNNSHDLLNDKNTTISFLGTGCAIPSKYRNVSGIFLQLEMGAMLLDAGEGSWCQLLRLGANSRTISIDTGLCAPHFSLSVVEKVELWAARELKAVWISHPHADHHLGLIQVLRERKRLLLKSIDLLQHATGSIEGYSKEVVFQPLLVMAPFQVISFLEEYCELDPFLTDSYVAVHNRYLDPYDKYYHQKSNNSQYATDESQIEITLNESSSNSNNNDFMEIVMDSESFEKDKYKHQDMSFALKVWSQMGIKQIENVKVIHCNQAYGVKITSLKGWSVVYSGDTRPCDRLIQLGRDATILIHEATFDDSMPEEAVKKKHCTISEALQVGKDMNVYRVLLTHFSQRYPGVPPLPITSTTSDQRDRFGGIIAFDLMRISFEDMLWAHLINPVLALAFPIDQDKDDLKSNADDAEIEDDNILSIQTKTSPSNEVGAFAKQSLCDACPPLLGDPNPSKRPKRKL